MTTATCIAQATRELEIEEIGNEIADLATHIDATTARLLELIREFDVREGWANGFRSCADWLTWRIGLAPGAAREHVRVARALGSLPRLADALARGELSYSKIRALTRIATREMEDWLLAVARSGTAEHVERVVRAWRSVDRNAELAEAAQRHAARTLQVYQDEDGMMVIRGKLEPEVGAVLMQALAAAREALYQRNNGAADTLGQTVPAGTSGGGPNLMPVYGQQQADALALLAETALHHGLDPGAGGERYQVVVHVDAAVLADANAQGQSVVEPGARVSAETSQRLACDASRVVMRHDADGNVAEVGARTRTIPPALRRALQHRDRHCRFPGCSVRFAQGHHIKHWADGGPTTLSNLVMLCRRHHRAVHEEHFRVERTTGGELVFRWPNGEVLPAVPPSEIQPGLLSGRPQ